MVYAACQEDALISDQPFVEALRHYARSEPIDSALGPARPGRGRSSPRLVPELSDGCRRRAATTDDRETRRYLMFEVVSPLTEAGRRTPLPLVLDDLHWADRPTLQFLRHVVRAPPPVARC